MITIEPRHYKIVMDILTKYPYSFCAYGSRAKGTPGPFSDLDLCSMNPIPRQVISTIKEEFYNSKLPYTVDLIDWNRCSLEFQACIKNDLVQLPCELAPPTTLPI
jgi:type I restriction enzyme S subunit